MQIGIVIRKLTIGDLTIRDLTRLLLLPVGSIGKLVLRGEGSTLEKWTRR